MDSQLQSEGLTIPIQERLGECVFAGNALISVNGSTPYNAVYGRVPQLLPNLSAYPEGPGRDNQGPLAGIIRNSHRLREVAVQAMVQGTAAARIGEALRTRTLPAGQQRDYKVGDQVEFYREGGAKDVTG